MALARARVRSVMVGGLAVTIRASSYVTFDLDFCYARVRENLSRLATSLRAGPVVINQRGRPVAVTLTAEAYEQMEQAVADVEAKQVREFEEAERALRAAPRAPGRTTTSAASTGS